MTRSAAYPENRTFQNCNEKYPINENGYHLLRNLSWLDLAWDYLWHVCILYQLSLQFPTLCVADAAGTRDRHACRPRLSTPTKQKSCTAALIWDKRVWQATAAFGEIKYTLCIHIPIIKKYMYVFWMAFYIIDFPNTFAIIRPQIIQHSFFSLVLYINK